MQQTLQNHAEQINDYLDLLNYAKQIGDTAWQEARRVVVRGIEKAYSKLIQKKNSMLR